MEHVVFFTAADGSPAYRRTANLDDAVRVVEHLRNAEGREEVHVYSLAPVALNFRPYYRVEINGNAPIPAQPDTPAPAFAAPAPAAASPEAQSVSNELAAFAVAPEQPQEAAPQHHAAAEPAAQQAPPSPPASEHMGAFMPMPPMAAPAEPAMAAAGQPESDDADQNGARGARSLGFFTR